MPDSVTTSSNVSLTTHAPGGLSISTVQNTSNFSLAELITIFGTNNVQAIKQAVTQDINGDITTNNINILEANLINSASTRLDRPVNTRIPQITRLSENEWTRGEILALFTASRPEDTARQITASISVVLNPERQFSRDDDIRDLYTVTSSFDSNFELERIVPVEDFINHRNNKEFTVTQFYTHSISTVTLSDYGYYIPSDAITDADNVSNKFTQYFIFDDVIYTDNRYIDLFVGDDHKYFKVSGSNEAWGITSRGKTYHKFQPGQKEKPIIRLIFEVSNKKIDPSQVCVDGDNPRLKIYYWHDHILYNTNRVVEPFGLGTGEYIKNITWDEAMAWNTDGTLSGSQAC